MTDSPKPTPGWYPDPDMEDTVRYWDGNEWTELRAPSATPNSPAPAGLAKSTEPTKRRTGLLIVAAACVVAVALGLMLFTLSRGGSTDAAGESGSASSADQAKAAAKKACPSIQGADWEGMGQAAVESQVDTAIPLLRTAAQLDPTTFGNFTGVATMLSQFSQAYKSTLEGLQSSEVGSGGSADQAISDYMFAITELKAAGSIIDDLCTHAR